MPLTQEEIDKKIDKYFKMTEEAISLVEIIDSERGNDFFSMAKSYFSDAEHFRKKGDLLTALAAVSYSHAWLDAGARAGLFKVDNSSNLFTVD